MVMHSLPNGKASWKFSPSTEYSAEDIPVAEAVEWVKEVSESVSYEPLEGRVLDPRGRFEKDGVSFTKRGFSRLCSSLDIPSKFLNRLSASNPYLASKVVTDQIQSNGRGLLLALQGGVAKGVVSSQYSPLPNEKVLDMFADVSKSDTLKRFRIDDLRFRASYVNGNRFDVNSRIKNPAFPLQKDDIIGIGMDVVNSEDGGNSFEAATFLWRLVCTNGMIAKTGEIGDRLIHRGDQLEQRAFNVMNKVTKGFESYLDSIPALASISVDQEALESFVASLRRQFSLATANRVIQVATKEAQTEGHHEITKYNLWNGLTHVASHSRLSFERQRALEKYAFSFVEKAAA